MSLLTLIILISIASAALGYEAAYTPLKRIFFLDREYPLVKLLSSYRTYKTILGSWFYLLLPIATISIVLLKFHLYLFELFQCPWCLSFWIAFIITWLFGIELKMQLIIAGVSLFAQAINNYIRNKSI